MTQANEPNDSDRDIYRQLRGMNRRIERLEYAQTTPQEILRAFDRGYDEIDSLEEQVERRFDRLENEVREMRAELNGKIDIIMRHITGL